MNHFKSNANLRKEQPGAYTAVRIIFAVTFLTVRFFMWLPNIFDWLKMCGCLCYTCDNATCYAGLGLSMLAGVGLTVLQLIWAAKIIEGLLKLAAGGSKKQKVLSDKKE